MNTHQYNGNPAAPLPPAPDGWAICTHEDEYARRRASTLGALPVWNYVDEAIPQAGFYRFFRWENAMGSHTISALRFEGASALGSPPGSPGGTLGAPNVGAVSGDAVVISATAAENACTSNAGPSSDGFVSNASPPADVEAVLGGAPSYGGYGPGYPDTYVMYKTGANAELWRLSYPESFTKCAQITVPNLPGTTPAPTSFTTGEMLVAAGGALLLLGGAIYFGSTR